MPVIQELRERAFLVLYEAGWSDTNVARILHAGASTIRQWRETRGLPRNKGINVKIDDVEARRMYDAGENDHQIARRFGMDPSGVVLWRQRMGLPSKYVCNRLTAEDTRKAKKMFKLGATFRHVADELGIEGIGGLQNLRRKIDHPGLRRHGITNSMIRARVLKDPTVQGRIDRAIGPRVPTDIRLDAVSDLYVDVLEGRVSADFIEQQAPSYRNRAYDMCGSRYGARSLDEENDNGLSLGDMLADPDAWDSMEVAAELAYEMDD